MDSIILVGFGGHCRSIIDTLETSNLYNIYGIIAEKQQVGQQYKGYEVIGTDEDLEKIYNKGIKNIFICIGYMGDSNIRNIIYEKAKKIGFNLPNIIDKTAILSNSVQLGEGIFIGKRAVLNAQVKVCDMCIINTGAIIEHDSYVGDFSHISVGSILCGNTKIEQNVLIGAGSTVIQNINIGKNTIIGAGSVVIGDVLENSKKYGVVK